MVMIIALVGLGIISLAEMLLWLPTFWRWHRGFALVLMAGLGVATIALFIIQSSAWTLLLDILSLYRGINLGRLVKNRMHNDYLFHASRRTALWLLGLQLAVVGFAFGTKQLDLAPLTWWYSLATLQLLAAAVLLASVLRNLHTTRPPVISRMYANNDLPSLTVAIPARNETSDLEACLESLLASTYPKLEILVLDDCSQNQRTPEIIRGFAHDGVQFIAGQTPPDSWLAKNYAYDQLAKAANGEILLFCGVDARFRPESLLLLVETLLQKQKSMLCVIPRNIVPGRWSPRALFLQSSRYAWELALPRRWLQRPPVLSTCWLITREALRAAGGFAAVTHKVTPESYLAHVTAGRQDGYSFLQADGAIGLTTQKDMAAQQATAIRVRYPQLHRRPELAALVSLAQLGVLVWPLIVSIVALATQLWVLAALSVAAYLLAIITYGKVVSLTYRRFLLRGLLFLPIAALYDIGLLNYSMWQYEFREVLWKGRNICLPVMRVIPRLPQ